MSGEKSLGVEEERIIPRKQPTQWGSNKSSMKQNEDLMIIGEANVSLKVLKRVIEDT